eukprot:g2777.t1
MPKNAIYSLLPFLCLHVLASASCQVAVGGNLYDFSALSAQTIGKVEEGKRSKDVAFGNGANMAFHYRFTPCGTLSEKCNGNDVAVIEELNVANSKACRSLGRDERKIDECSNDNVGTENNGCSNGVVLYFTDGDVCDASNPSHKRSAKIIMHCDPNQEFDFQEVRKDVTSPCNTTMTVRTKYACSRRVTQGGIFFGYLPSTVMLIILLLISIYVIGGIALSVYLLKKAGKATDGDYVEYIPYRTWFYITYPDLVVSGAIVTYNASLKIGKNIQSFLVKQKGIKSSSVLKADSKRAKGPSLSRAGTSKGENQHFGSYQSMS